MSSQNRQQVIFMGLLLLLLAIVSTALVFTLVRQRSDVTVTPVLESEAGMPSSAAYAPMATLPPALIPIDTHQSVLAQLEAARMLAAEEQKRADEQQKALAQLNERLQQQDTARLEAEQLAAELRERLDVLAAEMAELEKRRDALAKEREAIETATKLPTEDPLIAAQVDAETQRLEQLQERRRALEAEVAAAEIRQFQALEQQVEIEDEIIRRGGSITIRAPHDRRRDAIRLRDQMRQQSAAD
jgi:hypothetical protein